MKVIWGEDDVALGKELAAAPKELVPNQEVVLLPGVRIDRRISGFRMCRVSVCDFSTSSRGGTVKERFFRNIFWLGLITNGAWNNLGNGRLNDEISTLLSFAWR